MPKYYATKISNDAQNDSEESCKSVGNEIKTEEEEIKTNKNKRHFPVDFIRKFAQESYTYSQIY